jgi:endonuclease/exonuclease/phosphatase family metal-dependent hydrolase
MALKVLSYNIWCGGEERLASIAQVIRTQQPDAIALEEANSRTNAESLAHDLGMHLAYGEANSEFAVAWLSRLPIQHTRNHRSSRFAKTLLEIGISWEGTLLRLFATHLIHGRGEEDAYRRAQEVEAMLDLLQPLAEEPHLLVGDFNAIHPSDLIGELPTGETQGYIARRPIQLLLDAGYADCYRKLNPETPGYTYPSLHPWLRLDSIFASPALAARLSACDNVTGAEAECASDHLPVWAEFR